MPVHEWDLAAIQDIADYGVDSILVEEFMTTDLFTVKKGDIPELSADIMDWHKIRYIPVENEKSELVGLISSRTLLRYFVHKYRNPHREEQNMEGLMIKNPFTISPHATVSEAMQIMIDNKIGCLPVVNKGHLVGIITEANFLNITASLMKHLQKRKEGKKKK